MARLSSYYSPVAVCVDASGYAETQALKEFYPNSAIYPVNFTQQSKIQMSSHLRGLMSREKLMVPSDRHLLNEMSGFEAKISKSGNLLLRASEGMHDDIVCSLALAAWGAQTKNQKVDKAYWDAVAASIAPLDETADEEWLLEQAKRRRRDGGEITVTRIPFA